MVSPEKLIWSLSSVVPVSESAGWPQEEQNRALGGTLAPHDGQNMGDQDCTIVAGLQRSSQ